MGGESSRPELPLYKDMHEVKIRYVWTFEKPTKDGSVGLDSKIFPEINQSNPKKPQFKLCLESTWEECCHPGFKHRIDVTVSLNKVGKWKPPYGTYISKLTVLDSNGMEFPKHYELAERYEKIGTNKEVFRFCLDVKDSDQENAKKRIAKLKIACSVTWFEKLPPSNLESDINNLFKSGSLSDIELTCSGTSFKCHKLILAARSSVFATMFQNGLKKSDDNKVEIENMEPEVLEELLRYIYSGNCNVKKTTLNLLLAADMYDLQALKTKCEHELANNITMDNAMEALCIARKLDVPYLEKKLQTCFSKAK